MIKKNEYRKCKVKSNSGKFKEKTFIFYKFTNGGPDWGNREIALIEDEKGEVFEVGAGRIIFLDTEECMDTPSSEPAVVIIPDKHKYSFEECVKYAVFTDGHKEKITYYKKGDDHTFSFVTKSGCYAYADLDDFPYEDNRFKTRYNLHHFYENIGVWYNDGVQTEYRVCPFIDHVEFHTEELDHD